MLVCLSFALRNMWGCPLPSETCGATPIASGDAGNMCAGVFGNTVIASVCVGVPVLCPRNMCGAAPVASGDAGNLWVCLVILS